MPWTLTRSLLKDALLALLVGLAGMTPLMVVLLLLQVSHKVEGISAASLMGFAPSIAVGYQVYLIPLCTLAACALTYGRFTAEGELTAYFAAGGSPWKIMLPAIILGLLACLPAGYAAFVAGPHAYAKRDRLAREALVDVLDHPPPGARELSFPGSDNAPGIHLSYRDVDENGFQGLVVMTAKNGRVTSILNCARGKLEYDEVSERLSLSSATDATFLTLDANGEVTGAPMRGDVRLLERPVPLYGKEGTVSVKADSPLVLVERLNEDMAAEPEKQRGYVGEFVRRAGFAISPLLFALLGALVSCLVVSKNRIVPLSIALISAAVLFFGFGIAAKTVSALASLTGQSQLAAALLVQVLPLGAAITFLWWRLYRV